MAVTAHDLRPWYHDDVHTVLHQLGSDAARGLDPAEAARRLAEHGSNQLVECGTKSRWQIVWEQLSATMVVVLIVAAVISAILGDMQDTIVILAIVVLNAILGFS